MTKQQNIFEFPRTTGDANGNAIAMNDLTYSYKNGNTNSNLLTNVSDAVSNQNTGGFVDGNTTPSLDDYEYDLNGNMIKDRNKGIESIVYNHLNLPVKVTWTNKKQITYQYNAAGQKLKKTVRDNDSIKIVEYLDGFQYAGERLQFFPHAEGYVKVSSKGENSLNMFNYVFNYTDHLGNVRISYTKDPQTNTLKILDEDHYYPFGLKHSVYVPSSKREFKIPTIGDADTPTLEQVRKTEYQYKYQGQERQDELGLNWDSFKWRNYDPAIGRFFNVDPLTEKYNTWSPYAFSGNRVVDARELEGLEPYVVTGRTFIPNKTLSNPYSSVMKIKSFGGDNRNSYQVNTTAYRTEQKVRVDFDNKKATTISNKAKGTIGYNKNGKETATSAEGKAGPTPTYTPSTMENGSTTIGMEVNASNQLVSAPAINYNVNVTITETGDGTFDFNISGQSDGFPAYEFFITNEATGNSYLIHGTNPDQLGSTPFDLAPPMEVNINTSGNSKDLKNGNDFEFSKKELNGGGGSW